ncbi:putative O-methyltransferase 2, partial [Bienertia sinuspersici]
FEVDEEAGTYVVDLEGQTCSCGRWTLFGIPCWHAVACIKLRRYKWEQYVHKAYHVEAYAAAYAPRVRAMPEQRGWVQTDYPKPLPPPHRVLPGRPLDHQRKKAVGEDQERKEAKKVNR